MLNPIDKIKFKLNDINYTLNNINLNVSLNDFIRSYAQLHGTKFMCRENGCGVCTVNLIDERFGMKRIRAVNSCTYPIQLCHGKKILTIEGIGNSKTGYSKYQKILAAYNGTQCGYCSPGMIMNLHGLMESKDNRVTIHEMENSFGGNLCRCTGYRSILDACKSFCIDVDTNLLGECNDIEDIIACNRKICTQICESERNITIDRNYDEQKWYQPTEIKQLIDLLKSNIKNYILVSGNTAQSVYKSSNFQIFIDMTAIVELTAYKLNDSLEIGANVTIAEVIEIFSKVTKIHKNFKYLLDLNRHLELVATIQVRNVGTIAGNLMIKHHHNEFPSDLFVLFDAIDARLEIIDTTNNRTIISMVDFLKFNLQNKVILKVIIPQLKSECSRFASYKIMAKSQNVHAYVNCGFMLQFNETTKRLMNARICYGGISKHFQHAHSTEQYLVENVNSMSNLFTNDKLKTILNILSDEIVPDFNLPDEPPSYRKLLAINLMYKFLLNIFPSNGNDSKYHSGKYLLERPVSSGKQTFKTYEKYWPLTKPIPKLEGLMQSTGELVYSNDIPNLPGQLWAAFVIATQINENILSIDAEPALKTPGVVAFYSADDIPGKNSFTTPGLFTIIENEKIFCTEKVQYYGQPVGIIVAETLDLANMAANLVTIMYSKNIANNKIYITVDDILRDKQIDRISKTNPFTTETTVIADESKLKTITGRTSLGGQFHHSMEPQTCITYLIDDELNVHSATQWLDLTQIAIAECLNLSQSSINVDVRRLGGGFGGKISRATQIACACALATFLSKRPVRFVMTIESNMLVVGKRYSCQSDYSVKIDATGKIWKLDNVYFQDMGSSLNEDPTLLTTPAMKNGYDMINWSIKGHIVRTQTPSNTWCRAPGTAEGIAMIEYILEHIACQFDTDPMKIRQANMIKNSKIYQMFNKFIESTDYIKRRVDINAFNSKNVFKKKGISIMPMTFPIFYIGKFPATVSIFCNDGSVIITHGGIEMGQGINTKLAQVASFLLEIPIDLIKIKSSNTTTSPNSCLTGASITSESVGYAVKKSCEILSDRLKSIRNEMKGSKWCDITKEAFIRKIDLTASYVFKETDVNGYDVLGITCCEVEVDILTGNYLISRVDIIEETGESMNPAIDLGQIEGAFVMGLGYWLFEKLTFDTNNGNLLTNRTWNYKIPGAKDIPIDFRITLCQENPNEFGVLRSKTAGEPAFAMAIVAVFALQMAINAARKENNHRVDLTVKLPATPAHVLMAIGGELDRFKFY